jgi:hypothetical protein
MGFWDFEQGAKAGAPQTGRPGPLASNKMGVMQWVNNRPQQAKNQTWGAPGGWGGVAYAGDGSKAKPGATAATASMPAAATATNPYGTESGPGILENWFQQRAGGTDPGYEYAVSRGLKDLGTRSAARGGFNSGAAVQQESDYLANMGAQRETQLDALAGGASGEHQGRVNSMFNQGAALAGGQAGLAGQYDLGAAQSMSASDVAQLMMMLNKAGVDSQAAQGLINNIIGGATAYAGVTGKK